MAVITPTGHACGAVITDLDARAISDAEADPASNEVIIADLEEELEDATMQMNYAAASVGESEAAYDQAIADGVATSSGSRASIAASACLVALVAQCL